MVLNCNGKALDLNTPKIMGILNVSKNSFYDGGRFNTQAAIDKQIENLITEGASIIDIGFASTKPGAEDLPFEDEKKEVIRVLSIVRKTFPEAILSIDTQNSQIAYIAYKEGIDVINDISGGDFDPNMFDVISKIKIPYILTHTQGRPKTMQKAPKYQDVGLEIISILKSKIFKLASMGIEDVVVDPGFGFGKTVKHNYQILNDLKSFKILNKPLLVGLSRKSFIWKVLEIDPSGALNGTTVLNTFALLQGAKLLRVHDVKEAKEAINLIDMLNKTEYN